MGMVALVLVIACVNLLMLSAAEKCSARERIFHEACLGRKPRASFSPTACRKLGPNGRRCSIGLVLCDTGVTRLLGKWSGIEVSWRQTRQCLFSRSWSLRVLLSYLGWRQWNLLPTPCGICPKSSSSQSTDSRSRALRGRFVIAAQMAVCVTLLFGAGLLVRTLRNYQHVDLGMRAESVLAFGTHPVGTRPNKQMLAFYMQLIERVRMLPGVLSVTVAQHRPGAGGVAWQSPEARWASGFTYDNGRGILYTNVVGPGFFKTLGIPVLAGRGITAVDTSTSPPVAVVNQTFAERFLQGASPIGHTLGDGKERVTIGGWCKTISTNTPARSQGRWPGTPFSKILQSGPWTLKCERQTIRWHYSLHWAHRKRV